MAETGGVVVDDGRHGVGAAAFHSLLCPLVELSDGLCRFLHQAAVQAAPPGQAVEQGVLVEALHFHQPVHGLAFAAEAKAAAIAAGDRLDAQVHAGCGAPVDGHLGLAGGAAQLGRGEIEIGEADRFLQLVGALARQEDDGDVGFDALHGASAEGLGAGEDTDGFALHPNGPGRRFRLTRGISSRRRRYRIIPRTRTDSSP